MGGFFIRNVRAIAITKIKSSDSALAQLSMVASGQPRVAIGSNLPFRWREREGPESARLAPATACFRSPTRDSRVLARW